MGSLRRRGIVGNASLSARSTGSLASLPVSFKRPEGRHSRFVDLRRFLSLCVGHLIIPPAIMITSIVTIAAFAALTAADEVAWSGYAFVTSVINSENY